MSKAYKFINRNNAYLYTPELNKNVFYVNKWVEIRDNYVTVKKGYAWNGCSPKFIFLDLLFGTPDGRLIVSKNKYITQDASMVHDALYQFKNEVSALGISRKTADLIFLRLLQQEGFKLAKVYYFFVRAFGWIFGEW